MDKRISEDPITVKQAELERSGGSEFRSVCPVCKEGVLLVQRDRETLEIINTDRCIICGQAFIYEDF